MINSAYTLILIVLCLFLSYDGALCQGSSLPEPSIHKGLMQGFAFQDVSNIAPNRLLLNPPESFRVFGTAVTHHASPAANEQPSETINKDGRSSGNTWKKIWGKKSKNALLLGAYSYHMQGTGEFFGTGQHNERNHMLGLQYDGLSVGTFINSFEDRTWYAGTAREVYEKSLSDNTLIDAGYLLGICYGYKGDILNYDGFAPYVLATVGMSWKKIGINFGIMPLVLISASFRVTL